MLQTVASMYDVSEVKIVPLSDDAQTAQCFAERFAPVDKVDDCPISREYVQLQPYDPWKTESPTSRAVAIDSYEPLELGEPIPAGWLFAPDEEYSTSFTVHIPRDAPMQNELYLDLEFVIARGERFRIADRPTYGPELIVQSRRSAPENAEPATSPMRRPYPNTYDVTTWPIAPLGLIQRLTMQPQSISILRVLTDRRGEIVSYGPYLAGCITRTEGPGSTHPNWDDPTTVCPDVWYPRPDSAKYSQSMLEFYGVVNTANTQRIPLLPPPTSS